MLARSDLVMFRNYRDGVITYYRTHAAIIRSVAECAAGYDFTSLLLGPDGVPGTADDATVPWSTTPVGCRTRAVDDHADPDPSPLIDANERIRFLAECMGPRGARREVEAVIGRASAPFLPAALYVGRPDLDITASVVLDGADHGPGSRGPLASAPDRSVAAAASPRIDSPMLLPSVVRDRRGRTVTMRPTAGIDVPAFTTRVLAMGPLPRIDLSAGVFPSPFAHAAGDARIEAPTTGEGMLVIDGSLEIDAPVDFSGTVFVGGTLRVGLTGALSVHGSLWVLGEGTGPAITLRGPLTVLYSGEAVANADRVFRLPRRALVLSEREVF